MKLSIVIVNYNVKYFVEQCLYSVIKATNTIESEIWVVDNNSVDGSCSMIRTKFPEVKLIENKENVGFSKANNQAIRLSKGEYILLLNPDTIVEEDTFTRIVQFMDKNPEAGGLGVKMIDGKGKFLPESKRALPTPTVSFYKIFGLAKIFPKSKTFARYHLGHLDNNKIHEIEILSGAFMFMRKKVLDEIGLLDETFFMYGEDIDLSYRIIKQGYKNYYFPETKIIHYKGESTKKGSLNYVFVFYNAMIIFAKKHFSSQNAKIYSLVINLAIYLRAILSVIKRIVSKIILPLTDAITIFAGIFFFIPYWENFKDNQMDYPDFYVFIVVPIYILIWLTALLIAGGYQQKIKFFNLLKGIIWGSAVILILYALISEEYRYSRALIFIGSAWSLIAVTSIRYLLDILPFTNFKIESKKKKKILIIGSEKGNNRIENILKQAELNYELLGYVSINKDQTLKNEKFVGNIDQLKYIITINKADEIIFSAEDMSSSDIINKMLELSDIKIDYRIAPQESDVIIGSNFITAVEEIYTININSIATKKNKRIKRIFDIVSASVLLLFIPILLFLVKNRKDFTINIFKVLLGMYSWVGYHQSGNLHKSNLPKIKPAILNYLDINPKITNTQNVDKYNIIYAKDYNIATDIKIVIKNIHKLGRKCCKTS